MPEPPAPLWTRLLVIPPVAVGVAVLAWQVMGLKAPEQGPAGEIARPVRVVAVEPMPFVPRAIGYGHVQPGSVWTAVAEVSGKVVERHPMLETGKLFEAGTVILRIDPTDYELAVVRIEATIESVEAELAELRVRAGNTRSSLEIERRALNLALEDLGRKSTLRAKGDVSQAAVDEAERQVLRQRQRVQELENELRLVPAQRRLQEANLALNRAQLEEAHLDVERTRVRVPFEARIAEVHVEETRFVSAGQVLAVADSIDVAEVAAQLPIERMLTLTRGLVPFDTLSAAEINRLPERLGARAVVRLRMGAASALWEARVDRVSPAIDPETRTVGVVVAVDEPYRQALPGKRPPLVKNMFVQVELFGRPHADAIVVPRVALHAAGTVVYVAAAEDRLEIRAVVAGPAQGDIVMVEEGLEAGERVVVSDLIPAIDGMLLAPTDDPALTRRLRSQAAGEPIGGDQP